MKKFKLFLLFAVAIVMAFSTTSCSRVDAGQVGIKVNLLGSDKGVQSEVLGVGRYWIGMNEDLYLFPTYQVNYTYTAASTEGSSENEEFVFQTKEGMECKCDLGLAMHYDVDKITEMFQTYRKGEEEIRGVTVRNAIRDALNRISSSMPVESVYGEGKGKLIDSVQSLVNAKLGPKGLIIDQISLIGAIRIPQSVLNALNAKVTMTQDAQKAENKVQLERANAEIVKVKADAEAYANRTIAASITPTLVDMERVKKWNGAYPSTMLGSQGTMINLR